MDGRQEAIRADFQSNLTRIGDAVAARKRVADRDEQQLAAMSALPSKRIETQLRDVRFVPKADSCAAAKCTAIRSPAMASTLVECQIECFGEAQATGLSSLATASKSVPILGAGNAARPSSETATIMQLFSRTTSLFQLGDLQVLVVNDDFRVRFGCQSPCMRSRVFDFRASSPQRAIECSHVPRERLGLLHCREMSALCQKRLAHPL
jgi:hypothetical protein